MKFFYITTFFMLMGFNLHAQTYVTPELKAQEEKHITEKNTRLGIVNTTISKTDKDEIVEKKPFDIHLLKEAYILVKIEALDINSKHTAQEMREFNAQALSDYNRKNMGLTSDLSKMYVIDRTDSKNHNTLKISNENNILSVIDCKECQDSKYAIVSSNATEIVLDLKPQDEGQYFVYRFTFKK